MGKTILIVDDEPVQRRLIEHVLRDKLNFKTHALNGGQEAIDHVLGGKHPQPDLILLDLSMPRITGMDVIRAVRAVKPNLPIIVLTLHPDVERAVQAIKLGANDFLVKPAPVERLRVSIENTLNMVALREEVTRLHHTAAGQMNFSDLIGQSASLQQSIAMAQKAALSHIAVFIQGESGVGKEMFARAIHGGSDRAGQPFVAVNCGAIPENLVESELFGHEKGAFTGAVNTVRGKIREADGGTLFLDEIGELKKDIQVKLLRALQEGEIEPVGGKKPVRVNFRLISATNRNLQELVKTNEFREDLFYRINVFPVTVPALRKRKEDIPLLVHYFIQKFAAIEKRNIHSIAADAMEMLVTYDWPGNVRQLQNAVFRAVVLCDGSELTLNDFAHISDGPLSVTQARGTQLSSDEEENIRRGLLAMTDASGNVRALAEMEVQMIQYALQHYGNHMSEVARRLGIGRSTLYRKINDLNIPTTVPMTEEDVTPITS